MAKLKIITQNLGAYYCITEIDKINRKNKSTMTDEDSVEDVKSKIIKYVSEKNFLEAVGKGILEDTDFKKAKVLSDVKKVILKYIYEYTIKVYKKTNKAKIYAFQELPLENSLCFTAETIVTKSLRKDMNVSSRAEEIWDKAFPWLEFRGAYLDERDIRFAGEKIKIINVHLSPTYDSELRYTLLKRLSEVPEKKLTILLGDFNAAFDYQTEYKITENNEFLKKIEKFGFIECTASDEYGCDKDKNKKKYYTYLYVSDKKTEKKKLDHIFMSESLFTLLQKSNPQTPYEIKYIEKVNRNFSSQPDKAFTDHSGILLTINLPDP